MIQMVLRTSLGGSCSAALLEDRDTKARENGTNPVSSLIPKAIPIAPGSGTALWKG